MKGCGRVIHIYWLYSSANYTCTFFIRVLYLLFMVVITNVFQRCWSYSFPFIYCMVNTNNTKNKPARTLTGLARFTSASRNTATFALYVQRDIHDTPDLCFSFYFTSEFVIFVILWLLNVVWFYYNGQPTQTQAKSTEIPKIQLKISVPAQTNSRVELYDYSKIHYELNPSFYQTVLNHSEGCASEEFIHW